MKARIHETDAACQGKIMEARLQFEILRQGADQSSVHWSGILPVYFRMHYVRLPMKNLAKRLLFLSMLMFSCGASDITMSSLMQKKRHHEVIQILQPEIDRKETISSFQLYLLAGAYYEIRDYDNMLKTTDLLEKQIARGDRRYFLFADLSVYPAIIRGYAYLDQGDYDHAIKTVAEAHAQLDRTGEKRNGFYSAQLIDIAGILGVAHANLNHDAEAVRYLDILRGRNIARKILGPERFIAIARIHMALRQYREALAAVRNPEAVVPGALTAHYDQTFQELPKLFILTKCLYETGQIREAKENYDQLLKHPQIKQVGGLYWPVLLDRAKIARAERDVKAAETFLKEAIEVIEKQRATIRSEAGRIGYVGDKQAVYQEMITLMIAENRPEKAFEYVERAKGRALVDLLAMQKNIIPHAKNADRVNATVKELAKAENELGIVGDPGHFQDSGRTRGVVIALKKDISAQAPEFISLISVTEASTSDIRNRLAEDEALIEYYASDRDWFVFILKREGIAVKQLGTHDLEKEVQEFRATLSDPASSEYVHHGRELYEKLIAPVTRMVGKSRLTIVPHGPLHYVPFGALISGDGYLVDRANIRILPSASVLKFLKSGKREKNPRILIIGNPDLGDPHYDLKYAQDEAQAIARIMPGATLLLRDEAKASFVNHNADQFAMIHFAVHGIFEPDDPLGSALLLAADSMSNGRLKAGDLYGLNLHADLVTLSACETALGRITKGDDVVGFTRGFLYAGTASIISTLWKVDDQATKELMLTFYSNLLTMEKGEALRRAQLSTKKKYPHPFFWASFQLTGSAR
jgi:CHAT domain-containing protein